MSKEKTEDANNCNIPERKLHRRALIGATAMGVAAAGLPVHAAAEEELSQPGTVWWNEYLAGDTVRSSHFYARVVGWRMKLVALDDISRLAGPGESSYIMMSAGTNEAAGFMKVTDASFKGARAGWFTYIKVDDVDEAVTRAVQLGGKMVQQPFDDGDSRIAIIEDLEGCLVGLASKRNA